MNSIYYFTAIPFLFTAYLSFGVIQLRKFGIEFFRYQIGKNFLSYFLMLCFWPVFCLYFLNIYKKDYVKKHKMVDIEDTKKMIACLPFADNEAGLPETAQRMREMIREINILRQMAGFGVERCPDCLGEVSYCGEMTCDGPSKDCKYCQLLYEHRKLLEEKNSN
jgi:hypothetical protein